MLTELFYLTRHTSMGFNESLWLPVPVRKYFVDLLMEDLKRDEKRWQA